MDVSVAGRVLIVDNEKTESAVMKSILAESGFEVSTIPADSAGTEPLRTDAAFDLVIIDMTMGRADESESLRRVRNALPGTAVLLMTDNGTIRNVLLDIAEDFGIEYVKKPFYKDELVMSVRRALCRAEKKFQR